MDTFSEGVCNFLYDFFSGCNTVQIGSVAQKGIWVEISNFIDKSTVQDGQDRSGQI